MSPKSLPEFLETTASLTKNYLDSLKDDVSAFCRLYDYRNAGKGDPEENVVNSVERAIWYLTTRDPSQEEKNPAN